MNRKTNNILKTTMQSMIMCIVFLTIAINANSQSVSYKIIDNEVNDASKLKIRPTISFAIPPTNLVDGFPITFNLEAQYWTKLIDYRAALSYGTFVGTSIGATYHLVDKEATKNDKFVTSVTQKGKTETTTFFRAPVKMYKISGPCVDLTTGVYKDAGFVSKLDFGWDFQHYGNSTAEYNGRKLKGSKNGWVSMKLQGVLANVNVDMTDYFKVGAGTGKYTEERKFAIGAQVNFSAAIKLWNGFTFYASLPVGYMKYLGVSDAPETTDRSIPILNVVLGAQIRL